jgi:hypothetical protein
MHTLFVTIIDDTCSVYGDSIYYLEVDVNFIRCISYLHFVVCSLYV